MPCLSLIFERASVLYGSRSESRCVSRLDASIIKTGETSTMKCVLFGLFGSVSPFISLAMRCASCSILASQSFDMFFEIAGCKLRPALLFLL